MRPAEDIDKLIKKLRYKAGPETHDRVLGNVLRALEKKEKQKSGATAPNIWRTIMKSPITRLKLATATVIIAAIVLGMYALTGSVDGTSITMAQVRQAMQGIDWMKIINKGGNENETQGSPEIDWFSFGSKVHITVIEGRVRYSDFKTHKRLWWGPGDKDISEDPIDQTEAFAYGAAGPFEMMDKTLLHAARGSNVVKELGTYQGQKSEVWMATNNVKGEPGYTRTLTVYIDLDKKLPIAATYDHNRPDGTVRRESDIEFKYPKTGPADIYEAGAPRSAQIKSSPEP